MTATLRQVREALQGKVATINGTPTYTIDLSGTDDVKVGRFIKPWATPPCACLFLATEKAEQGPTLVGHTRRPRFGLAVWLQVSGLSPESIEDVIEDAYEDVRRRFRAATDRTLGRLVIDVEISLDDVVGPEETGTTGLFCMLLAIVVQFDEVRP